MRWIEATVPAGGDADALCAALAELGVGGMVVEDERDFHEFLENNRQYWDYVDEALSARYAGLSRVKFYLSDDEEGRATLERVRAAGYAPETAFVEDSDWENNWRDYYKPIEIGETLAVVPEWEDYDDPARKVLRLDPGLIFGTGSHATTRMCLEAVASLAHPGERALDLGCGSGILGIAARLFGADAVVGCDIDPKAPDVARANAALNGFEGEDFRVYAGDVLADASLRKTLGTGYGLVLANIVADVIIPLSGFVRQFMAPGAKFVCSGIIDGREDEVASALEKNGMRILSHKREEEWHCFVTEAASGASPSGEAVAAGD